jgi:hypothetical protein
MMRKIVEDVSGEGLEKLLLLEEASIVYETVDLTDKKWKDAQPLPHAWYVQLNAIESFGVLK